MSDLVTRYASEIRDGGTIVLPLTRKLVWQMVASLGIGIVALLFLESSLITILSLTVILGIIFGWHFYGHTKPPSALVLSETGLVVPSGPNNEGGTVSWESITDIAPHEIFGLKRALRIKSRSRTLGKKRLEIWKLYDAPLDDILALLEAYRDARTRAPTVQPD